MDDTTPSGRSADQPRISPNAPKPSPVVPTDRDTRAESRRQGAAGFWSFLRTLFVGTAGLALLAVVGTLAGSAWLTANQRAEADKPQPWADASFTTTAVTTGGLLARWMDNDGNLDNGHSYIKGIYDRWKSTHQIEWESALGSATSQSRLPQLWQKEFKADHENVEKLLNAEVKRNLAEGLHRSVLPPSAPASDNKYDTLGLKY